MKLAICLIALCGVLFVVMVATPNSTPRPQPGSEGALKPPAWASMLADLPFGPRLDLKTSAVTLPAGGALTTFSIPASSSKSRIGRFSLTQGQAAMIVYTCGNPSMDHCQQIQCLVAASVALPPGCDAKNFSDRDDPRNARISVFETGGKIELSAPLGAARVSID